MGIFFLVQENLKMRPHLKFNLVIYVSPFVGVSIHWLGDYVFVESVLGVRVKFDLVNSVYVTVTSEHLAATRGLCGIYNNNPNGAFIKL